MRATIAQRDGRTGLYDGPPSSEVLQRRRARAALARDEMLDDISLYWFTNTGDVFLPVVLERYGGAAPSTP
jgi:hypothetical protein